jgi:hypothetical protein
MIIRELPNGQLLCINQTTHALMAEEFCRHWGNQDFARPTPYSAVMLGISQHDNGWYEWERTPQLRQDGYPEDFMHRADLLGKLALWRRGIKRLYAQHPYAALLLSRHAALLYKGDLRQGLPEEMRQPTAQFIQEQDQLQAAVVKEMHNDPLVGPALAAEVVEANTWLLKFGDSASLQVIVPWAQERTLARCPVDFYRAYQAIRMTYDTSTIHFDPWPFAVEQFTVTIHGKLLNQRTFHHEEAYHAALAEAPWQRLSWQVVQHG